MPVRAFERFILDRRWLLRGRVAIAGDSQDIVAGLSVPRWDEGAAADVEQRIGLEAMAHLAPEALDGIVLLVLVNVFHLEQRLQDALKALKPGGVLLFGVVAMSTERPAGAIGEGALRNVMAELLPLDAFEVTSFGGQGESGAPKPAARAGRVVESGKGASDCLLPVLLAATARKPGAGSHPRTRWARPSGPGARSHGALVLAYHRVASLTPDTHGLCVRPERFREHIRYLEDTCTPLTLEDTLWAARDNALPPRAVAVTVDDGYLDALTTAAPILCKYHVPATFFVNTESLDQEHEAWHDCVERVLLTEASLPSVLDVVVDGRRFEWPVMTPEQRLAALFALHGPLMGTTSEGRREVVGRLVSWSGHALPVRHSHRVMVGDEVRALSGMPGCAVGSHSAHHLRLPIQPVDVMLAEVRGCRLRLEALLDRPVLSFSYPFGEHSPSVVEAVRATPHLLAVTVERGLVTAATDPILLPRLEIRDCELQQFASLIERAFS